MSLLRNHAQTNATKGQPIRMQLVFQAVPSSKGKAQKEEARVDFFQFWYTIEMDLQTCRNGDAAPRSLFFDGSMAWENSRCGGHESSEKRLFVMGATVCETCRRTFPRQPSQIEKSKLQFCSMRCRKEYEYQNSNRLNCIVCGKEFRLPPARVSLGIAQFCSKRCKGIKMRKKRKRFICLQCGSEIWLTEGVIHNRPVKHGRFCSQVCLSNWKSETLRGSNHRWWKGGIKPREHPREFNDKLKQSIRDRDNHTCQICGMIHVDGNMFDVHHIDYDKEHNNSENLVTLCHPCHTRTGHNRERWKNVFTK